MHATSFCQLVPSWESLWRLIGLALVGFAYIVHSASPCVAEPRAAAPEMLEDATLFDLHFADAERGWAVGDRGVIWLTEDGGQHWHLADSPVNCRLESITFLDHKQGWAVGGWVHPYRARSTAVLLRTDNGGQRWQRVELPTLPGLHAIHMFNLQQGWAWSDRSAMYPSGLLRTEDGGRSWHDPLSRAEFPWTALAMVDRESGFVAGPDGRLGRITGGNQIITDKPLAAGQQLRAIQIEGKRGWAVGDAGLVLRTRDGGKTFQSMALPRRGDDAFDALAVAMVNEQCWLAGAPGHIIWHSPDGGQTWLAQPTGISTPLHTVTFVDALHGWAAGAMGTILKTRDGGQTWQVQKGSRRRAAYLVLVSQPERIPFSLLARLSGDEGYLGVVEVLAPIDPNPPARLGPTRPQRTWAAVSATGATYARDAWQFSGLNEAFLQTALLEARERWAPASASVRAREQATILANQASGRLVPAVAEVAAEPASLGDTHFAAAANPSASLTAPIAAKRPADVDSPSRSAPAFSATVPDSRSHAAWFEPSRSLQSASPEAIGGSPLVLASPSGDARPDPTHSEPAADKILRSSLPDASSLAAWETRVISIIRQWKPEVVITEHVSADGSDPLAQLTNQLVLSAVRQAAEPLETGVEQEAISLQPWRVKKVFSIMPSGQPGTIQLEHARVSPRLGNTVGDAATHARSLLAEPWQRGERQTQFQLLVNQLPQTSGRHDFFSGLALEPGGEARRKASLPATKDLAHLTRLARKRGLVEQILLRSSDDPTRAVGWLAQLDDLTSELDSQASGHTLYDLAQYYELNDHHDLAADVYLALLRRYPEHDLAESSWLWLIRYYSSHEIERWVAPGGADWGPENVVAEAGGGVATAGFIQPLAESVEGQPRNEKRTNPRRVDAGGKETSEPKIMRLGTGEPLITTPLRGNHPLQLTNHRQPVRPDRTARTRELLDGLRQTRPALYAEPEVQLLAASQARAMKNERELQSVLTAMTRSSDPSWRAVARGELWLLGLETGPAPKPRLSCPRATSRPRLDGELGETIWLQEPTLKLSSSATHVESLPTTSIWLVRDHEFLYLAIRAEKTLHCRYERTALPRTRDANLSAHDRLQLLIDVDRDYNTCFSLQVDHRGWPAEACVVRSEHGGIPAAATRWNPTWYIAQSESAEDWQIEAAIPLAELTVEPLVPRDHWSIGVSRNIPQGGTVTWPPHASLEPILPETFGFIEFEP